MNTIKTFTSVTPMVQIPNRFNEDLRTLAA